MSPRRFVFNPPGAALFTDNASTRYLASNEPSILLEELPDTDRLYRRHGAQLAAIGGLALPSNEVFFEDDLSMAYRAYRVRRLWVDAEHERESPTDEDVPPVGNAPPRAMAAAPLTAARLDALLGQPGEAGAADECLYLFNPIVALEWLPTPERLRRLQWAFRRASDYLYDVTNGTMAFGQVIFGDATWMGCADIQILASNRYLPRSWVGGLYEPHKYTPIRLGRGLWVRDRRVVVEWDEPEGYRAMIHEWAHYAMGMKDEYMRGRVVYNDGGGQLGEEPMGGAMLRAVLPDRRVKSDSIMASPQGNSELGNPMPIASEHMRGVVNRRYKGLEERLERAWSGPGQLPLPLPHMALVGALAVKGYAHTERPCAIPCAPQSLVGAGGGAAAYITLDNDTIPTGRREVFVLSYDTQGNLQRISAQGELDAGTPERGFTLLGAAPGDSVVILDSDGSNFQVWTRTLSAAHDTGLIQAQRDQLKGLFEAIATGTPPPAAPGLGALSDLFAGAGWQQQQAASTTPAQQALAVIPQTPDDGHKNGALVRLSQTSPADAVFGVEGRHYSQNTGTGVVDLPSLDGYVVSLSPAGLNQGPATTPVFSDFSQGGPPASAPSMVSDPIAAGAASGEALLLCDVSDSTVNTADYRVVTTTSRGLALPGGLEPLSPVYTIASNLPLHETFTPTLLIVNVQSTPADAARTRVWLLKDDGAYTALPTYVAPNGAYGAAPLTAAAVPTLISNASGAEPGPRGEYVARFVLARV